MTARTSVMVAGVGVALAAAATVAAAPFAYFAGDTRVVVVDTATDLVVDEIPIVDGASGITIDRSGTRVYVHSQESDVTVIDATTNATLPPLPLPDGEDGTLEVHPLGTAVYVNNNAAIVVKDPANPASETAVPVAVSFDGPTGLLMKPDGSQLYVSVFNTAEVRVLDTATNTLLPAIPVAAIRGSHMDLSPDGQRLYVPHRDAGVISIIDTATNTMIDTITGVGDDLHSVVAHPDGTRLYAMRNAASPQVVEIALPSKTTTATIPTPAGAFVGGIVPDGSKLYVYAASDVTSVVTTSDRTVATIPLPEGLTAIGRFIAPQRCGDGVVTFPEGCDDGNTGDGDCCPDDCTPAPTTTACTDDGNACSEDRCDGAGACVHVLRKGSTCDDGDACTADDVCRSDATCSGSVSGACLDDILCYGVEKARGSAKPAAVRGLQLSDGFASRTADARKVTHLCTPARDKALFDAATHLGGWKLAKATGTAGPKGMVVTDLVATVTLDVQRPVTLLVPSSKALQGTPVPPDPASHQLDTHACYGVKPSRGAAKPPRGLTRTLAGQFTGGARTFALKKPRLLCPSASVGGAATRFPGRDLLCWQVKAVKGQAKPPRARGVGLASNLGAATLDVGAEQLLCLRAGRN
jgi:YVTN family beta-propeller protein